MPESAIGAFARTWSTPCTHNDTPRSTARGPPNNSKLPVELLLIIFQLVYENQVMQVPPYTEAEVALPSLFPYALAAVCSFWRNAMSTVPEYWTRVVIFFDPPTTPILAVASLLTWSRDLPLDVTLTRKTFNDPIDATHERTHLISVLNLLQRVIHHIKNLRIYATFSSSIPSFPDEFRRARMLRILKIDCKEDNGGHLHPLDNGQNSLEHWRYQPFRYPNLAHLTLDGRSCYNAFKKKIWCTDLARNLQSFHIYQYKPQPGESFSAYDLLHPLVDIASLEYVTIANVAFAPKQRNQGRGTPAVGLHGLDLRDYHDFGDIDEIYRILGTPHIATFVRCRVESPTWWYFDLGGVLELVEISGDQDLVPRLRNFEYGDSLKIRDCPGFDDRVLAAMSVRRDSDGEFTCAPLLTELYIEFTANNDPTFSVAALKEFVDVRIDWLQEIEDERLARLEEESDPETDDEEMEPVLFETIKVSGNAPYLSPEDRAWFVERTKKFRYPET